MNSVATYIALLRGINVGGRNRLPMQALREILANLGLLGIRTYVQSGNAVFESPDGVEGLNSRIGHAIGEAHGFVPQVQVLTRDAMASAAAENPFPDAEEEPKSLHLSFLDREPDAPDLDQLNDLRCNREKFKLVDRVFYLHAPDGIGRSRLAAAVEAALGVSVTGRNWRTVQAILAMADERRD